MKHIVDHTNTEQSPSEYYKELAETLQAKSMEEYQKKVHILRVKMQSDLTVKLRLLKKIIIK